MQTGLKYIQLAHGRLDFPVYLPDATFGVVRAVDAPDLVACQVQALVMNTFHLMQRPGSSTVQSLGGVHRMSGWQRPIVTDSGGFQAYSLIRQNPKFGSLSDRGLSFQPEGAERKFQLTPEKSVQLQFAYGSDVVICLDDPTHVDASLDEQRLSVERTITWAKRSKQEYERQWKQRRLEAERRPLLFGVIQGGGVPDLRKRCADALLEIGFDGFGYGGWPLDGDGNLLTDILGLTRELVPNTLPMHALGVGHPENVAACYRLGYDLFDSAMPTRDARHGRLYTFTTAQALDGRWLEYVYVADDRHIKSDRPVSEFCDCHTCRHFSLGYLRHLYKLNDSLYPRLATIHNLRFMTQLTDRMRESAA
ncbi:MAG: tRNA-guanine transglycosylase [Chloroflexi bacterium]|nr:tRNA guanosine(34) transglycosylase Tgt [Anaerolineaceae bacterium]NMB88384.1 tRNA-guanine transglycosylase [Chloroflexota bacterium]